MTTVPPSSSPLPQMLAAAVAAQPVATVAAPPPALALLQAGAQLEGIATPTSDPRVTLLATAAGDVSLRTPQPAPLPDGAKLTVEIVRATPQQLTVRFTAVDGQPLQQAVTSTARATPAPVATVVDPTPALAATPVGTTIVGTIARGPDPRVPLLATPKGDIPLRTATPLPEGARLEVEVTRTSPQQVTVRLIALNGQALQPTPAPRAAPAPVATVSSPTPALAAEPVGTRIVGTIERGPDPRVTVLATPKGDIPLRTDVSLPQGATLEVVVTRTTPEQVTVRLVAVNGQPVQQAPAPLPQTPPPPPGAPGTPPPLPQGQAWWPGGAQPVTALPTISAFVLNAPPVPEGVVPTGVTIPTLPGTTPVISPTASQATPTAQNAPQATQQPTPIFSTGADLALKITAITLPTAAPVAPAAVTIPAVASGAPPVIDVVPTVVTPAPAQPNVAATAPQIPLQAMSAPAIPIDAAAPAPGLQLPRSEGWPADVPQPPATVQTPAPAAVVTGTVIRIADGVPVVRIADADVQLNIRANLPVGTTVTLEVRTQQLTLAPPMAPAPPAALVPLSVAQPGWPALAAAVQMLQRLDPQAAQALMNAIPDGGPRTAAAMMSFAQALRTGETRQWPGDASLRALERAGPRGAHLAGQIAAEVADLGRQARDVGTEWRALPMPWQADGKIERIRLLMRETDPDAEAEKRKRGGGTRFVIDLDLSRLGPLQVDGMIKPEARNFDVMIRTKTPLPEEMQRDLAGIFATSNAAMNLVGGLTFQVVKKFPDPSTLRVSQDKSGLWV